MNLTRATAWLLLLAPAAWGQSVQGLWDATLNLDGTEIPFKIGFSGEGDHFKGWFFNGEDREVSNSGKLDHGSLTLHFDSYAAVLKANVMDGKLDGEYVSRGVTRTIHAVPAVKRTAGSAGKAPDVAGMWDLEGVNSAKGERAWHLVLRQSGEEISGAILRVDGDTGNLSGNYQNGKFILSHFSGARPSLLIITPQSDGTLALNLDGQHNGGQITAYRPEVARARGLPEPTDPDQHTGVRDASEPFAFRFPDLNGTMVSNTDVRFRNKVVLINITGSWCPNCHDEAPFLAEIYNKYHSQGLEIVAISFEEAEQLANPVRLKAFIKEYGIRYTVLLGGETSTAKEKLTQAVNWDAWPTTFFVGRDGMVKGAHAGFAGPASGELHVKERAELIAKVEQLLGQNQAAQTKPDR